MEVQTRSEDNGLRFFSSLREAFREADRDKSIWKISFNAEDGSRVRLIWLRNSGWTYAPILEDEEFLALVEKGKK